MKLDDKTTRTLLERHGIHLAKSGHPVAPGTDVSIDGRIDETGRRIVRARSAAHATERIVPLGDEAADELADGLRAHHHHLHDEAGRHMLRHLFLRVSDLFEHEQVEAFSLDPVRLHEKEFTVVAAAFFASSPPHVTARLTHHAHDRKSFRASGEQ